MMARHGGGNLMPARRNRRAFIAALGGAAAWPVVARAQHQMRRLGYLAGSGGRDPTVQGTRDVLMRKLEQLGWIEGRNLTVERRFAEGDLGRMQIFAKELVALGPDVIFASPAPVVAAVLAETRTIPVVFTIVADPVGVGFIRSLANPGGNVTGFTLYDHTISTKWLELLKEAVPTLTKILLMHSPAGFAMDFYIAPARAAATRLGVSVSTGIVKNEADIDQTIAKLAHEPGPGLIVLPDTYTTVHRLDVIAATVRHRVPAIYPAAEYWSKDGGLIAYGADLVDMNNGAEIYIDRILRGEKAGDLPVQQPTKYTLAINLTTAKAIGIKIPESLLVRADEVIE